MHRFFLFIISAVVFASCTDDGSFSITGDSYKKAWVKAHEVSLRINPSTVATRMDVVPYNTEMKIIKQAAKPKKIGSENNYWYMVRLPNGVEGWVYGSGLSFSKNPEVFRKTAEPEPEPAASEKEADKKTESLLPESESESVPGNGSADESDQSSVKSSAAPAPEEKPAAEQ
jgi:hypothetical protein